MRNKPFYASPLNESLIYKLRNALKTQIKYLKGIYRASVYERHNEKSRLDPLKNRF